MNDLADDLQEGAPPPLPEEQKCYPTHPLFPLPEGVQETKDIYQVSFDRWDHQGRKERCPDRFLASELTSLSQVIDMFGGGTYQFFAFNRQGNYARWTSEKDKVRIALPCKPFRAAEAPEPAHDSPTPKAPSGSGNDLVPLLIASQERADRMLTALLERIASHPPAAPSAPDPMAMLTGLATVLEKLRPPPSGDMVGQLSGLVSVAKQMAGPKSAPGADADAALQPILTMMSSAIGMPAASSPPPPPAPSTSSTAPSTPPGMVWVDVPQIGPVLMRPDQAAAAFAQLSALQSAPAPPPPPAPAPPPPAAPVTAPRSFAGSWDDVAIRLKDQGEQRAFKEAIERVIGAAPTAPPPAPTPPRTPSPAPAPVSPPPAATPADEGPRCIVCGSTGTRDAAHPDVLVCRSGHRCLLAQEHPPTDAEEETLPLDALSLDALEELLEDDEFLRSSPPEMIAIVRRELAAKKGTSAP